MTTIGLDLHKRDSQLCIGHEDGRIEEAASPRAVGIGGALGIVAFSGGKKPTTVENIENPQHGLF